MFDIKELAITAQMVIGQNESDILQAASNKIEDPNNTSVGLIRLAKADVIKLHYGDQPLVMSGSDFYHHKKNLLSEMDEAINAATRGK
ncbi:hypothetical protein [Pseudoalteromonas prydzensis]|uniref:hypothetical protein n=1 Tax=Pseudoalteromonas prydzensis TaxID=182141 RepID=UPI003FD5F0C5